MAILLAMFATWFVGRFIFHLHSSFLSWVPTDTLWREQYLSILQLLSFAVSSRPLHFHVVEPGTKSETRRDDWSLGYMLYNIGNSGWAGQELQPRTDIIDLKRKQWFKRRLKGFRSFSFIWGSRDWSEGERFFVSRNQKDMKIILMLRKEQKEAEVRLNTWGHDSCEGWTTDRTI